MRVNCAVFEYIKFSALMLKTTGDEGAGISKDLDSRTEPSVLLTWILTALVPTASTVQFQLDTAFELVPDDVKLLHPFALTFKLESSDVPVIVN